MCSRGLLSSWFGTKPFPFIESSADGDNPGPFAITLLTLLEGNLGL